MSQPFKLYRLQQIDSQIDQVRARLQEIENILNDETQLVQAQEYAERSKRALHEAQQALKRIESEVEAQRLKIEQTETALYGGKVRNPKELQDLQNESKALSRYLAVLEDRQLEAMLLVEEAEGTYANHQEVLESSHTEIAERNELLLNEKSQLMKMMERQTAERQAAASSIVSEDLSLYEKLRPNHSGVAVAKVSDNACSACGSTLSAAHLQAAHSANQITRCTSCGRILYAV